MRAVETFVLRVWVPGDEGPARGGTASGDIRGFVDHVASGRSEPFVGTVEMLALIHEAIGSRRSHVPSESAPIEGA